METRKLTADDLLTGAALAAKLIVENPDLAESAIDTALNDEYAKDASAEEWEMRTRKLLKLEQGADA